jgi:peroxiredoxin Q/BCP
MFKPGDQAPDFTLPDQAGNPVSLSGLRGRNVVLYFYPKADTRVTKSSYSARGRL